MLPQAPVLLSVKSLMILGMVSDEDISALTEPAKITELRQFENIEDLKNLKP